MSVHIRQCWPVTGLMRMAALSESTGTRAACRMRQAEVQPLHAAHLGILRRLFCQLCALHHLLDVLHRGHHTSQG